VCPLGGRVGGGADILLQVDGGEGEGIEHNNVKEMAFG
jgi:hypothetical protein